MSDRWKAFSEQECGLIAVALAGNLLACVAAGQSREQILAIAEDSMALMDSMAARMGLDPVNEAGEQLRRMVAQMRKADMN